MTHAEYRLTLPARPADNHEPAIAAVLQKAKANMGMIPNMYADMANVAALLDTYLLGYDASRAARGFTPAEQEARSRRHNGAPRNAAPRGIVQA